MADKTDGRIVRTKKLLRDALIALMKEKGFESISVGDLTERAGLNRGTFYLHYRDKYDLLERCKAEILDGLFEKMKRVSPLDIMNRASLDEPDPNLLGVFHYFADNADFFSIMLGSKGDSSYPEQIKAFMKGHIFEKLAALQPQEEKMLVPREFIIAFAASAHIGIVQQWFADGMTYSPRYMALLVTRLLRFGPLQSTGVTQAEPGGRFT